MNTSERFYYDAEGRRVFVELPYARYYLLREKAEGLEVLERRLGEAAGCLPEEESHTDAIPTASFSISQGVAAVRIPVALSAPPVEEQPSDSLELSEEIFSPADSAEPLPLEEKTLPLGLEDQKEASVPAVSPEPLEQSTPVTPVVPVAEVPSASEEPRQAEELTSVPSAPEKPPVVSKEFPISVPDKMLRFLEAHDTSGEAVQLFTAYCDQLGKVSGGRISTSMQEGTVCLWNYDEWATFAYFGFSGDRFCVSVKKHVVEDEAEGEEWLPPRGLSDEPLVRYQLDHYDDDMLSLLRKAFTEL